MADKVTFGSKTVGKYKKSKGPKEKKRSKYKGQGK